MKSRILALVVILAVAVAGCQKSEKDNPVVKQDLSFGIQQIEPTGLKAEFDCPVDDNGNLLTATHAEIEIEGVTYTPEVFFLNGKLYTQAIKLEPGTYEVTKFLLTAGIGGTIVMATPEAGGEFAEYVTPTVPFDITVGAFVKTEIPIDVLCFVENKYTEFGFFWFNVTEIVVRQFCFFGDICAIDGPYGPSDFAGSLYAGVQGGLQIDMPAIFKIVVKKDGVEVPNSPFSNVELVDGAWVYSTNSPLCVNYPDKLRTSGEEFTFELWILVPDGIGGFVYSLYHTFTSTDDGPLSTLPGADNVVEFVLGTCNYTPTNLQLSWGQ